MQSNVAYNVNDIGYCSEDCYSQVCTLLSFLSTVSLFQVRVSTRQTDIEDEQDDTITRSLIIAHQCTVDNLQRLENEEVQQQAAESNPMSPQLPPGTLPLDRVLRAPTIHKPSRSFDKQIRSPIHARNPKSKRASVWINSLIFDDSPLPLGFRRQTWCDSEYALFLDKQPYHLLQKWTDQGEHLEELRKQNEHLVGGAIHAGSDNRKDEEVTLDPRDNLLDSAVISQNEHKQRGLATSGGTFASRPPISPTLSSPLSTGGICSTVFIEER
jgi:hypothetical protein